MKGLGVFSDTIPEGDVNKCILTPDRRLQQSQVAMPSKATKFIRVMYGRSDDRLLPKA